MPTSADKQLLDFALSAELSVHDLYVTAIDSGMLSADEKLMMEMFSEHHKSYAQSLNGLLGKAATNTRNEALYSTYVGQLTSAQAMNRVLQSIENTMVATHTDILSSLQGMDGATLVASIITVEARHAAVFGTLPTSSLSSALNSAASSLAPNAATSATTTETTVAP
jgi:superoxide dismutase